MGESSERFWLDLWEEILEWLGISANDTQDAAKRLRSDVETMRELAQEILDLTEENDRLRQDFGRPRW